MQVKETLKVYQVVMVRVVLAAVVLEALAIPKEMELRVQQILVEAEEVDFLLPTLVQVVTVVLEK